MIIGPPTGGLGFPSLFSARIILMRKYWAIFRINWQKSVEYRADFIGHLGMGIISFVVMYFIWSAVFRGRETFGGYTFSSMMTYVLMTKFLHFIQRQNVGRLIADEIKEGKMSMYLIKPVNYLRWWFSIFLADRSFEFLIRLTMLLAFFVLLPKVIPFLGMSRLMPLLLFIFISLIINFFLNLFIASFAFWLTDVRLFRSAIFMIFDFFAGGLVPIDIMPPFLKNLGLILPFQFTAYFPIKLYQGSLSPGEIVKGISLAVFWTFALGAIISFVWQKGVKRYEAVGQ